MPYPEEAEGFQVDGPSITEFHKRFFKLKPFGDYDVDVKIEACGICGSDVHTISGTNHSYFGVEVKLRENIGGWGEQKFPLCVGHGKHSPV
jgi:alcohol dehydrogenase (NADP+)